MDTKEASPETICIFHSQREDFKNAFSCLRKALSIPTNLTKYAAMAVCSCRKNNPAKMSATQVDLYNIHHILSDSKLVEVLKQKEHFMKSCHVVRFMEDIMTAAKTKNESALRFIVMLKMALDGDFQLLDDEKTQRISKSWSQFRYQKNGATLSNEKVEENPNRPQKMRGSIHFLLQKRKRQAGGVHKTLILPMFGGNMKTLHARPGIGQNFRGIGMRYQPCVIEVDYEKTGQMMTGKIQKTILKVWCLKEHWSSISRELTSAASQIQDSCTVRFKQHLAYVKSIRCESSYGIFRFNDVGPKKRHKPDLSFLHIADPYVLQENRWEDFSKKRHAQDKVKVDQDPKKKPGLRCYNCLTHHDELLNLKQDKKLCKSHPGFVKAGKWSCCGKISGKSGATNEEHLSSGCCEGIHDWRYQNKKVSVKRSDAKYCRDYVKLRVD